MSAEVYRDTTTTTKGGGECALEIEIGPLSNFERALLADPRWPDVALALAAADNAACSNLSDLSVRRLRRAADEEYHRLARSVLRGLWVPYRRCTPVRRGAPCRVSSRRPMARIRRPSLHVAGDEDDSCHVGQQETAERIRSDSTRSAEPDVDDVLTVEEGAKLLKVGRNCLYEAIARGEVPHRRIGKNIRLSRSGLMRWLASCGQTQVAKKGQ